MYDIEDLLPYIALALVLLLWALYALRSQAMRNEDNIERLRRDLNFTTERWSDRVKELDERIDSHNREITALFNRQAVDHDQLEARVEKLELDADFDD